MSRRYAFFALALSLLLTGCAVQSASQEPTLTTTPTVTAAPAPSASPSPEVVTETAPVPAEPVLTVTTTGTMPWTPAWEPPTFDGTYRLIDEVHGFPESGTKYVLSHARSLLSGARSPGNDWLERVTEPEQIVVLDGVRYAVTAVGTVAKTGIADAGIWGQHDPNRVVLITCVALWDGVATENRIITLTKESP